MEILKAGFDWTATPSLNEPFPYGPAIVAVENESALEAAFERIRVRFEFGGEIKGHDSSSQVLGAALETLLDCDARVGCLLLDKRVLLEQTKPTLPAPAILRHQMACALAERFIEKHALARLKCDDEIRGKSEWRAFRTAILRANRRLRPGNKMKVAAWPSHQSALVQAADCVAYVAARAIRGAALDAELRGKLRALQARSKNIFEVTDNWESKPEE